MLVCNCIDFFLDVLEIEFRILVVFDVGEDDELLSFLFNVCYLEVYFDEVL